MYAVCAGTAGVLAPKGGGRTVPVGSMVAVHLPLHYTEEWLFAVLLKQSYHITSNAVAVVWLTEDRNSVGSLEHIRLSSEVPAWESLRSPLFLSVVSLPVAGQDFIGFRNFI